MPSYAVIDADGVVTIFADQHTLDQQKASLCTAIDVMRDEKIDSGFAFDGHRYQTRPSDRENIMGANTAALAAVIAGVQSGNLRWADPDHDFVWITEANELVAMDAPTVMAFYKEGLAFKSRLTFFARQLKDSVLAAATVEELDAIDTQAGWPT